ncbi:MAG: hypothetical protein AAF441_22540 [Pseudomonadota bacterium]
MAKRIAGGRFRGGSLDGIPNDIVDGALARHLLRNSLDEIVERTKRRSPLPGLQTYVLEVTRRWLEAYCLRPQRRSSEYRRRYRQRDEFRDLSSRDPIFRGDLEFGLAYGHPQLMVRALWPPQMFEEVHAKIAALAAMRTVVDADSYVWIDLLQPWLQDHYVDLGTANGLLDVVITDGEGRFGDLTASIKQALDKEYVDWLRQNVWLGQVDDLMEFVRTARAERVVGLLEPEVFVWTASQPKPDRTTKHLRPWNLVTLNDVRRKLLAICEGLLAEKVGETTLRGHKALAAYQRLLSNCGNSASLVVLDLLAEQIPRSGYSSDILLYWDAHARFLSFFPYHHHRQRLLAPLFQRRVTFGSLQCAMEALEPLLYPKLISLPPDLKHIADVLRSIGNMIGPSQLSEGSNVVSLELAFLERSTWGLSARFLIVGLSYACGLLCLLQEDEVDGAQSDVEAARVSLDNAIAILRTCLTD